MKMDKKCGKLWKKVDNLKRQSLCTNVDNFWKLFKKWGLCLFFIVEIWVNMLSNVYAAAEEEIQEPEGLYAQSAVLMDADSGRILFAKKRTRGEGDGQYHENHDLYPRTGKWKPR